MESGGEGQLWPGGSLTGHVWRLGLERKNKFKMLLVKLVFIYIKRIRSLTY